MTSTDTFLTWHDGTIYHCSDEGYFCEFDDDGRCTHCSQGHED